MNNIIDLFLYNVTKYPDAIAVKADDILITYSQLDNYSNKLAYLLIKKGVTLEKTVIVVLPRSIDLIVTILAILKSGGHYVVLNLMDPINRQKQIIEQIDTSVFVMDDNINQELYDIIKSDHIINLSKINYKKGPYIKVPTYNTNQHLAYIAFTSGSTGKPKGVCISHNNIVDLINKQSLIKINCEDILLQFAPISFDASIFEIWAALLNGAQLVLYTNQYVGIADLINFVEYNDVTVLWLTSGLFSQVVDVGIEKLKKLKFFISGGDVLSPQHISKAIKQLPSCNFVNGYGPTENTTFSLFYLIDNKAIYKDNVPIGTALPGKYYYILNENLEQVHNSQLGLLYLGGTGLCRGYHKRPDLTAQKFIPDPFNEGERIYNSMDLVFKRESQVLFSSRSDARIKIRGFLIEPAEIVNKIRNFNIYNDAFVIEYKNIYSDKILIAFVILKKNNGDNDKDEKFLKRRLRKYLPEYMIPTTIIFINEFPLNSSGKVCVKSLRLLFEKLSSQTFIKENLNDFQQKLISIWNRVFNKNNISKNDSFFDLGGNSLIASRITAEVRSNLNLNLRVQDLYTNPTITLLSKKNFEKIEAHLEKIRDLSQDFYISPEQNRIFSLSKSSLGSLSYNIIFLSTISNNLYFKKFSKSIDLLINKHPIFKVCFKEENGTVKQYLCNNFITPIVYIDVSERINNKKIIQQLYKKEAKKEFNLTKGPLFRITVYKVAKQSYKILFIIHHIIFDGISLNIFQRDLIEIYNNILNNNPYNLKKDNFTYFQYINWKKNYMVTSRYRTELKFWNSYLSDVESINPIKQIGELNSNKKYKGYIQSIDLKLDTMDNVLKSNNKITYNTILLTVLTILLYKYNDTKKISFGVINLNRYFKEFDEIIGFFANTLIINLNISDQDNFISVLKKSQKDLLKLFSYQNVPYDQLLSILRRKNLTDFDPSQILYQYIDNNQENLKNNEFCFKEQYSLYETSVASLSVTAEKYDKEIKLYFGFSKEFFNEALSKQYIAHFNYLLESLCTNPLQKLKSILLEDESKVNLKLSNNFNFI